MGTADVQMRIYEVIHHWFIYKEKEGRHIRKYIIFISPCVEENLQL